MKKNYTKPEIEVSRYDVTEATMAPELSAWHFTEYGSGSATVDTLKVVNYTAIFDVD